MGRQPVTVSSLEELRPQSPRISWAQRAAARTWQDFELGLVAVLGGAPGVEGTSVEPRVGVWGVGEQQGPPRQLQQPLVQGQGLAVALPAQQRRQLCRHLTAQHGAAAPLHRRGLGLAREPGQTCRKTQRKTCLRCSHRDAKAWRPSQYTWMSFLKSYAVLQLLKNFNSWQDNVKRGWCKGKQTK